MKKIILLNIFSICFLLNSQETEKVDKPKRVVYNYTTNEIIESTKLLLLKGIENENGYDILSNKLFIGPLLWHKFKENQSLIALDAKNVQFNLNNLKVNGKLSENLDVSKSFWSEFRNIISKSKFIIRKANYDELEYYWTVISWDIDEPLLILQTEDKRCFILDFEKATNKLFWIDEFSPNHNESENLIKIENGNIVFSDNLLMKETKLANVVLLSSEDEIKKNISNSEMKSIIERTNKIFKDLFLKHEKSGKILVEFELQKQNNKINVVIKEELEQELKFEFEKRLNEENFPNTKKKSIKFILLYIVNSINKF